MAHYSSAPSYVCWMIIGKEIKDLIPSMCSRILNHLQVTSVDIKLLRLYILLGLPITRAYANRHHYFSFDLPGNCCLGFPVTARIAKHFGKQQNKINRA